MVIAMDDLRRIICNKKRSICRRGASRAAPFALRDHRKLQLDLYARCKNAFPGCSWAPLLFCALATHGPSHTKGSAERPDALFDETIELTGQKMTRYL